MEQPSSPADAPATARTDRPTLDELTALALGLDPRRMTPVQFYLGVRGRISLRAYWLKGLLVFWALGIVVSVLLEIARVDDAVAKRIFLAVFTWPYIAVVGKRLHDLGLPAWGVPLGLVAIGWMLMQFLGFTVWALLPRIVGVAIIGGLVAGLVPGRRGANRYGPDPRAVRLNSGH